MAKQVITPTDLGDEFDLGNIESGKVRFKHLITESQTFTIGTDFATIEDAHDYLQTVRLIPEVTVNVVIPAGEYTVSKTLYGHPDGSQITYRGATSTNIVATDIVADQTTTIANIYAKCTTKLTFATSGFVAEGEFDKLTLRNLLIVGSGSGHGVRINESKALLNRVFVVGFNYGITSDFGSFLNSTNCISSSHNNQYGLGSINFSSFYGVPSNTYSMYNGTHGLYVIYDANYYGGFAEFSNNGQRGVYLNQNSYALVSGSNITNNGGNGAHAEIGSNLILTSSTFSGNSGTDIFANEFSNIRELSGTAGTYSPAFQTVGNHQSYIR